MLRRIVIIVSLVWVACAGAFAQAPAAPALPPMPPPPASPTDIKQVNVSVKIVEFQTSKGVETGLSAYFLQQQKTTKTGRVITDSANVRSADITFPTNATSAITVFLDQLHLPEGNLEVVLQGLVDQDRAFILSQPKAMVTIGSPIPTTIQTSKRVPYENTVVVGATAVQTTAFRDTGVSLTVQAPAIIDDDANPATTDDIYIQLLISAAVNEEGQKIVVALDDKMGAGGIFGQQSNAIKVPEFFSRSVATSVWVRHGQVLLLGGLYRNTKDKKLATLPWLLQGENAAMGLLDNVVPGTLAGNPVSASLGNRAVSEGRRELVFLIKAELWRPAYTVAKDVDTGALDEPEKKKPTLGGVIQGITDIPKSLGGEKTESPGNVSAEPAEGGGK